MKSESRAVVLLVGTTIAFNMPAGAIARAGELVAPATIGMRAAAAAIGLALLLLCGVLTAPASAQLTIGSAGEPPRLALGVGAFDVTPSKSHKDAATAAEFRGEYRFPDMLGPLAPFIGASVTSDGAAYGYFGFGLDINFNPEWVLTPNAAAGVFEHGSGTNLGSWWEFRTGAELAYRFADHSRLGVAVHHTSNAGLTKRNPGEQSVLLVYSIPMP